MRYPEFLKDNGTIGFVAPSFGCVIEPYHSAFKNALKKWEKMGYYTHLGPNCFKAEGVWLSNTPELCGKELNEWYASKENDVLISCGGGELMVEVVPYIDFARLKEETPKWYMGYSDNTNFVFLSATLMDTAAIYGPCAPSFGMEPWHVSLQDTWDLLSGKIDTVSNYDKWEKEKIKSAENPLLPYNLTEPMQIRRFPDEDVELSGRLLGGCLDILQMFPGSPYDKVAEFNEKYKEDGIIWFLESCDLNNLAIRRAIWQLKQAGWFQYVKAFLIGRPRIYGEEDLGLDQYKAVTDLLGEYNVPIIMDLDIGHLPPMMPLICGGSAKISCKDNSFKITYTFE